MCLIFKLVRAAAPRGADENRENCWNAHSTWQHHSVARKGERDSPKSLLAGVISSRVPKGETTRPWERFRDYARGI